MGAGRLSRLPAESERYGQIIHVMVIEEDAVVSCFRKNPAVESGPEGNAGPYVDTGLGNRIGSARNQVIRPRIIFEKRIEPCHSAFDGRPNC